MFDNLETFQPTKLSIPSPLLLFPLLVLLTLLSFFYNRRSRSRYRFAPPYKKGSTKTLADGIRRPGDGEGRTGYCIGIAKKKNRKGISGRRRRD